MRETQAKKAAAQARLKKPEDVRRRMTREKITDLVTGLGAMIQILRNADPADKAEVYQRLGMTLTYHPKDKRVKAEVHSKNAMYVGECPRSDTNLSYMIDKLLTTEFTLAPGGAR